MSKVHRLSFLLCLFLFFSVQFSRGDVGSAAYYGPPYSPTACFGGNMSQFPTSNMFGSAGEGIWDNGAACGRLYQVRCMRADQALCIPDRIITIAIVDRALTSRSRPSSNGLSVVMVLSSNAFGKLVIGSTALIHIEFTED